MALRVVYLVFGFLGLLLLLPRSEAAKDVELLGSNDPCICPRWALRPLTPQPHLTTIPLWSVMKLATSTTRPVPARVLLGAVVGAQLVATCIAVYGALMTPLGRTWAAAVWGYA
ncbi:hypothetical protein NGB36_10060 [Streptomyces sp. RB6PN25]|uniref:Integral membrane protein n=1 Tax=Streptomyces humicola TaxID=2953240 RepID=A0ABT1PV92_9ACTN|nr:hypothetical protein [Streptomyces humicola]MCQ4080935.1 hypothetical protein [Streptomyces humicola]